MMIRAILLLFALCLITGTLAGNVTYATNPILKAQHPGIIKTTPNVPVDVDYEISYHLLTNNVDYMTVWFTRNDPNDYSSYKCYAMIWDTNNGEKKSQTDTLWTGSYCVKMTLYAGEDWDANDFQHDTYIK